MDKELLKKIVVSQVESNSLSDYVQRDIWKDFNDFMSNDEIIIFSWIRRSGKSTLLNYIRSQYFSKCYINFDDLRLSSFEFQDFEALYEVFLELFWKEKYYYFDEIQLIPGWEKFIRTLHNEWKKVVLTGSNASMLSRELWTHLTWRNIQIEVFPFSFIEFLRFKWVNFVGLDFYSYEKIASVKWWFLEYLNSGGFPQFLKNQDTDFYKSLHDNIFYKDVVVRYNIKHEKTVGELLHFLFSNISKEISFTKLKNILGLASATTVKEYVYYFENSYLLFVVNKFDYSLKKQILNPKKIYTIDTGLSSSISFEFSSNLWQKLENVVFLELKRRKFDIYYFREKKECDFLLTDRGKVVWALQVCWNLYQADTRKRELDGLIEAMERYKLTEGMILTNDEEEILLFEGKNIRVLPVWKWLLEDKKV
jgi:uncharacterized protein